MISDNQKGKIIDAVDTSLLFLGKQGLGHFHEATHILRFPFYISVDFRNRKHYGDAFAKSIILSSIFATRKVGFTFSDSIIRDCIDVIAKQHIKYFGWRYFPKLVILPPDIDDLAQILQTLISHDVSIANKLCLEPLNSAIENCLQEDGSLTTWIVENEKRSLRTLIYKRNIKKRWGNTFDPEVIANFLYALLLFDRNKYLDIIKNGVEYLKKRIQPNGFWKSTWYWGQFYGTYMCSRIISFINPDDEIMQKVVNFLKSNSPLSDKQSNSTQNINDIAFYLLTWSSLKDFCKNNEEIIKYCIDYLLDNQEDNGGWKSFPFIKMRTSPEERYSERYLSYESQLVTTAYTIQSLVPWIKY